MHIKFYLCIILYCTLLMYWVVNIHLYLLTDLKFYSSVCISELPSVIIFSLPKESLPMLSQFSHFISVCVWNSISCLFPRYRILDWQSFFFSILKVSHGHLALTVSIEKSHVRRIYMEVICYSHCFEISLLDYVCQQSCHKILSYYRSSILSVNS